MMIGIIGRYLIPARNCSRNPTAESIFIVLSRK